MTTAVVLIVLVLLVLAALAVVYTLRRRRETLRERFGRSGPPATPTSWLSR